MRLVKIERQHSVKDTYINIDQISGLTHENDSDRMTWIVSMQNGVCYDINDRAAKILLSMIDIVLINEDYESQF